MRVVFRGCQFEERMIAEAVSLPLHELDFGVGAFEGAWADPERELLCVILTSRPWRDDRGFLLRRIGNVVQGAIE